MNNTSTFKEYPSATDSLKEVSFIMKQSIKIIRLENVNYLKFQKKGKKGKSTLIGGAVGFGLGGLIGLITYSPCSSSGGFCVDLGPGASALGGGILGLIPGLIIGRIVGGKTKSTQGRSNGIQFQKQELGKNKFWD